MIIFDEFGARWRVRGGDPAARHVNRLRRLRYELVVLPLVTLATGRVSDAAQQPEDIVRAVRLGDCIAELRG